MSVTVGRLRRDTGISVARPTALGNPFKIGPDGTREEVIAKYRVWFERVLEGEPTLAGSKAREMYQWLVWYAGKGDLRLLCHCAPQACHGDVIAESIRAHLVAGEPRPELLSA